MICYSSVAPLASDIKDNTPPEPGEADEAAQQSLPSI